MIISLFVRILTVRYLGQSNHGLVNCGIAYVVFFASLCNLNINSIIVKILLTIQMSRERQLALL